jgi:tetratricopeptide (TPR) repeat protein
VDREIGDRLYLGRKLSNVGQMMAELGDADTALEFIERAEEVYDVVADEGGRADNLCAQAEVLLEFREDLDGATHNLDRAQQHAGRIGELYDLARERIVRATLEASRGDHAMAEACAREAIEIASSAGIAVYEVLARAYLVEALARLGRKEEAGEMAIMVKQELRHGMIERAERVYLALARALELMGRGEEAAEAFGEAFSMVEKRLAQIRDPRLRGLYMETPTVQAIRAVFA